MARIRTVKPEFWSSESVGRLTRDARLLFIAIWNLADDSGRLRGALPYLAGAAFPYDEDARDLIGDWLDQLIGAGCVRRYVGPDGNVYLDVPKWKLHQRIDKPSISKIPEFPEPSRSPPGALLEPSRMEGEGEGEGKGGEREGATPARSVKNGKLTKHLMALGLPSQERAVEEWKALLLGRLGATTAEGAMDFVAYAVEAGRRDGVNVQYPKHAAVYVDAWRAKA